MSCDKAKAMTMNERCVAAHEQMVLGIKQAERATEELEYQLARGELDEIVKGEQLEVLLATVTTALRPYRTGMNEIFDLQSEVRDIYRNRLPEAQRRSKAGRALFEALCLLDECKELNDNSCRLWSVERLTNGRLSTSDVIEELNGLAQSAVDVAEFASQVDIPESPARWQASGHRPSGSPAAKAARQRRARLTLVGGRR